MKTRFAGKALIGTAGNAVYLLSLWLLTVFTTKLLGYEAVGELTLAMTLGSSFGLIQTFGARPYHSSDMAYRYCPADYLRMRLISCGGALILCLLFCLLLGYSLRAVCAILLFHLFKLSEAVSDVFFGEDQRLGRLELTGYSMALRGLLTGVLFFAGASVIRSLNGALAAIAAGGMLITLLLDLPLYRKTVSHRGRAQGREVKALLRECIPMLLSALIPTLVTAVPRVVLERFYGEEILGFYGNAAVPALLLSTSVPIVITMLLSYYGGLLVAGDHRSILSLWKKTVAGAAGLGIVTALGILLFGKPVLTYLYTQQIIPYIPYVYWIIGATLPFAVSVCCNAVLVTYRDSRHLLLGVLIALALSLILSVPLVRAWGMGGAVAALVIPYGVQAVLQTVWVLQICRRGGKEKTP